MNNKPIILCMLWGNWGGANPIQYVKNLRNMVARHTTIDYDFYCITDRQIDLDGVNVIELPTHITKWKFNLPKFYMHADHQAIKGRRILFFDLDTVIVGNIDEFLLYGRYLCTIKPFNPTNWHVSTPGGVLSFVGGETAWIWNKVKEQPEFWVKTTGGKERLILNRLEPKGKWDRWQDILPGQLVSYKRHVVKGKDIGNARVVAFHGNPRPHVAARQDKFINQNWQ
jgi:hypothetical protein